MQPGPVPTVVVGTGPSLVASYILVQREGMGLNGADGFPRAARVPFLLYLGKDFGAETCCHPCPFRVRRNATRSLFSWSVSSSGRTSGSW